MLTESITRSEHWATRSFHEFLKARANMPFAWGKQDCALFAADGILAMTGVDIAAEFRGKYQDEVSAYAAIEQLTGGNTVEDAAAWCATRHGLREWPYPLLAQRGDLVVFRDPEPPGEMLAERAGRTVAGLIHLSGRHIVAAGELGLKRILIHDGATSPILRAWHV